MSFNPTFKNKNSDNLREKCNDETNESINQVVMVPNQKTSLDSVFDLGVGQALVAEEEISAEGCGACIACGDGGDDGN